MIRRLRDGDAGEEFANAPLLAAVFVKRRATRIGPLCLGHVGWAFRLPCGGPGVEAGVQTPSGVWVVGSIDNPGGVPVRAPGRHDFWTEATVDPRASMRPRGYVEYKLLPVARPSSEAALRAQARVRAGPYALLFANCMDGVRRVLGAYGASLPRARPYWSANDWYDRIASPSMPLRPRQWERATTPAVLLRAGDLAAAGH